VSGIASRGLRPKHMTWEYMVREFNVQDSDKILLLEEFLNETGKDGWELVRALVQAQADGGKCCNFENADGIAPR
jgi:hypothetical protein